MKNEYTSSIIYKYGDTDSATKDVKVVSEVFDRQGAKFLIDVISEKSGTVANKFKLTQDERHKLINNLVCELLESLQERL